MAPVGLKTPVISTDRADATLNAHFVGQFAATASAGACCAAISYG